MPSCIPGCTIAVAGDITRCPAKSAVRMILVPAWHRTLRCKSIAVHSRQDALPCWGQGLQNLRSHMYAMCEPGVGFKLQVSTVPRVQQCRVIDSAISLRRHTREVAQQLPEEDGAGVAVP